MKTYVKISGIVALVAIMVLAGILYEQKSMNVTAEQIKKNTLENMGKVESYAFRIRLEYPEFLINPFLSILENSTKKDRTYVIEGTGMTDLKRGRMFSRANMYLPYLSNSSNFTQETYTIAKQHFDNGSYNEDMYAKIAYRNSSVWIKVLNATINETEDAGAYTLVLPEMSKDSNPVEKIVEFSKRYLNSTVTIIGTESVGEDECFVLSPDTDELIMGQKRGLDALLANYTKDAKNSTKDLFINLTKRILSNFSVDMRYWITKKTNLLRKQSVRVGLMGEWVIMDAEFYDYNKPVEIALPKETMSAYESSSDLWNLFNDTWGDNGTDMYLNETYADTEWLPNNCTLFQEASFDDYSNSTTIIYECNDYGKDKTWETVTITTKKSPCEYPSEEFEEIGINEKRKVRDFDQWIMWEEEDKCVNMEFYELKKEDTVTILKSIKFKKLRDADKEYDNSTNESDNLLLSAMISLMLKEGDLPQMFPDMFDTANAFISVLGYMDEEVQLGNSALDFKKIKAMDPSIRYYPNGTFQFTVINGVGQTITGVNISVVGNCTSPAQNLQIEAGDTYTVDVACTEKNIEETFSVPVNITYVEDVEGKEVTRTESGIIKGIVE